MMKFVKAFTATLLVALFAAILVACGDNPTPAPANTTVASNGSATTTTTAAVSNSGNSNFYVISGASTTEVPAALQSALNQYATQYPGSTAQAFKTSTAASDVKSQLASAFSKEGWQNISPNVPDTAGGFALAFTKGTKAAAVVGFPGMMANLGQNENLYIVYLQQ